MTIASAMRNDPAHAIVAGELCRRIVMQRWPDHVPKRAV
jgi:hypothetical protein